MPLKDFRLKGISILVVDDDPIVLSSICAVLESAGARPRGFEDTETALSSYQLNKYDIALVDIIMPEENGLLLLSRLKNSFPDRPVIMISAVASDEVIRQCYNIGADDFIPKPFSKEGLVKKILLYTESKVAAHLSARAKILFVDDSEDIKNVILDTLKQARFNVVLANSADETERKIAESDYDAIIVDTSVDNKRGIEIIGEINRIKPHSVLAALTKANDDEDKENALAAGAMFCLPKSIKPSELLRTINWLSEVNKTKKVSKILMTRSEKSRKPKRKKYRRSIVKLPRFMRKKHLATFILMVTFATLLAIAAGFVLDTTRNIGSFIADSSKHLPFVMKFIKSIRKEAEQKASDRRRQEKQQSENFFDIRD